MNQVTFVWNLPHSFLSNDLFFKDKMIIQVENP